VFTDRLTASYASVDVVKQVHVHVLQIYIDVALSNAHNSRPYEPHSQQVPVNRM